MQTKQAFTLLELLAVVALIAILAILAIINLQAAQAKSKVARVRADMTVIARALEAYRVDHRAYPPAAMGDELIEHPLVPLTGPVKYLAAVPEDPFGYAQFAFNPGLGMKGYNYKDKASTSKGMPGETYGRVWKQEPNYEFFLHSCGPNRTWDILPYVEYDPSNGIVSYGDITVFGP